MDNQKFIKRYSPQESKIEKENFWTENKNLKKKETLYGGSKRIIRR